MSEDSGNPGYSGPFRLFPDPAEDTAGPTAAGEITAPAWPPGTIAVDWESRSVRIRGHEAGYWYDSRALNVGPIRLRDETVTPDRYEIIRPAGTGWASPAGTARARQERP